jgi:hypothetical protein
LVSVSRLGCPVVALPEEISNGYFRTKMRRLKPHESTAGENAVRGTEIWEAHILDSEAGCAKVRTN